MQPAPTDGALRELPVRTIVRAIADAAKRWSDADFPPRVRAGAALEARTGYSPPVVDFALDTLFATLDAATLEGAIADELSSLDALDGGVRDRGVLARAVPVGRACIVASETTIGVALVPALFALCAKCDVIVKDRNDGFVAAFFATLAEERPEFAHAALAREWDGGQAKDEDELFARADTVIAFGRDETLKGIRARLGPDARFIGHGHRAGIGYIARTALPNASAATAIARGAARDLVLYEGEGCMSLHALFIETDTGVSAPAFIALLSDAVRAAAIEFPPRPLDPGDLAAVNGYRSGAAFRAALGHGAIALIDGTETALILDPPASEPPPLLPRTLPIYPVQDAAACVTFLQTHRIRVETVALAGEAARVGSLEALDAVRFTHFGEMQRPSAAARHGGRARIADFVRWVETEL